MTAATSFFGASRSNKTTTAPRSTAASSVATNSVEFGSCSGTSSPGPKLGASSRARASSAARVTTRSCSMSATAPGSVSTRSTKRGSMFSDSAMHDVIVIGGGPAGSTASTLLAREGFRVTLFERERFPRFQIGESMLPYSNDIFRRLGVYDKLVDGGFFPKYGAGFVTADGSASTVFRFRETLRSEEHTSELQSP